MPALHPWCVNFRCSAGFQPAGAVSGVASRPRSRFLSHALGAPGTVSPGFVLRATPRRGRLRLWGMSRLLSAARNRLAGHGLGLDHRGGALVAVDHVPLDPVSGHLPGDPLPQVAVADRRAVAGAPAP